MIHKNFSKITTTLFLYSCIVTNGLAGNAYNTCKVSKTYLNNYEPQQFPKINNLLRATGDIPIYQGKKIIIKSRVVDVNCVPIIGAKISLWQVNDKGKYPFITLRSKLEKSLVKLDLSSTFLGAGTAITDNKGEFSFVTLYPAKVHKEKPHLNIRVEHPQHPTLQTKVYLDSIPGNRMYDDFTLNYFSQPLTNVKPFGDDTYQFQLVLPKS